MDTRSISDSKTFPVRTDHHITVIQDAAQNGEHNIAALVEWNRQRIGQQYPAVESYKVRSLGIVGAGVMGTSIAAAAIQSNLSVTITDARQETLDSLPDRVALELCGATGCEPCQETYRIHSALRLVRDLDAVAGCDLVLEAVFEELALKQRVLPEIERQLPPGTVLASNTSTISIDQLAAGLSDPSRICGIHFFLPVCQQRLIEIVAAPRTSQTTLHTAVLFAQSLGKIPLVVPDGPAFLVNRLMMMYLSEALQLVMEGVPIEQVDQIATDFGMVRGPLRLIDQIGLDIVFACAVVLHGPMQGRLVPAPLLVSMIKEGRIGQKVGAGFFRYPSTTDWNVPGLPDPDLAPILTQWVPNMARIEDARVRSRLFLPMVLEATRILAEGRLDDPRAIDLAVVFGFGFPAGRGGLLYWADMLGANRIVQILDSMKPLGERMEPTQYLRDMAAAGRPFYSQPFAGITGKSEAAE